jgi:aminopeptidase-like protein
MIDAAAAGEEMSQLVAELYPICRSITGDGVRETLGRIAKRLPLAVHEVPTGTPVLDWTIPREWNIRDAWVKNARGERVVDFRASTLHVVSYSVPVRATMTLAELRPRLHTLPAHPDWIPYRTSYYAEDWGFCLSANRLAALEEGEYEVVIDSSLEDGALTYGEYLVPGREPDEVLVSAHVCHPSLANDNLSGIALAVALARHVETLGPR